jgi:hypothetical protein
VRHGEVVVVEELHAPGDLLLGELPTLQHLGADLLRHHGGEEGPHLLAEGLVLGRQGELHGLTMAQVTKPRATPGGDIEVTRDGVIAENPRTWDTWTSPG